MGAVLVVFVVIFLGVGMPFVVNVVGFFPPALLATQTHFSSHPAKESAFLKKNWMSYFVLMAFLNVLETNVAALLVFFKYYYALKLAILVYAFSPQWRGAAFFYDVLAPRLSLLEAEVAPKKVD